MEKLIALLVIIAIAMSGYAQAEDCAKLTNEELFKIYSEIMSELELPTIDLNKVNIEKFGRMTDKDKDYHDRDIISVGCWEVRFAMDMDPYTGKIYACHNYAILDIITAKDAPLYKRNTKPFKKKDDIVKEAEHYLKILNNGKMPDNIRFNEATFNMGSGRDPDHLFMGEWSVWWDQMEGPYVLGSIVVFVNEKYGLSGYGDNRYATYYPPKEIKITKEKAIEMANRDINRVILKGFRVQCSPSAELYIVHQLSSARELNPNYVERPKSYARLAWGVTYKCVSDLKFKDGTGLAPSSHSIYYDAETGEVLGVVRQR